METVYLSLGSNVGDRLENMQQAITNLSHILQNVNASTLYNAEPVGMKEGTEWFLNAVVKGEVDISPQQLLSECAKIEELLGRVRRSAEYEPRTMDIDILFYGHKVVNEPNLQIPHPRAHERKFVLVPMAELSKNYMHPVLKKTIWQLLAECNDPSIVEKYYGKPGV